MKNLKAKLYNAIILLCDESETEYNGLEDENFIEKICRSIGMTETEYKDLMLKMDFGFEYDFQEICPHCDYVNDVCLSETKEYKDGKRILICKNCGQTILACNLCDSDSCNCCDCGLTDGEFDNANGNFIDDEEKMRDFKILSKEEFLKSYSYLTEAEYNNTKDLYDNMQNKDKFNIDEIINKATEAALKLIRETDLTSLKDLEEANTSVPVGSDWQIFMDFGHNPDLTEIWLWFSLEDNTQDGWLNSLDEQDTTDLSEESIRLNLRYLLEDWQ